MAQPHWLIQHSIPAGNDILSPEVQRVKIEAHHTCKLTQGLELPNLLFITSKAHTNRLCGEELEKQRW